MGSSPAEAEARVDGAIDSLQASIRELRNFIYGLRPETMDGGDIPAGIVGLAEQFRYNTLVEVDLDVDRDAARHLSPQHGAEVLQLVREALSNASRHAQARHVAISLGEKTGTVELVVADDGVGFDPSVHVPAGHQGLGNMEARATGIGGTFRIESAIGKGTRIILVVPPTAA
jgi:signal transduction histidine kinase